MKRSGWHIGFGVGLLLAVIAGWMLSFKDSLKVVKTKDLRQNSVLVAPPIPAKVTFAGEKVPLQDFEVRERFDRELLNVVYNYAQTIFILKRANRWKDDILKTLREENIPEDFFYLMAAESHFGNGTSVKGARGFWQFMPATAKHYQLEVSDFVDERCHVTLATKAACRYLKDAYQRFGNWTLVAASYNMGVGGVKSVLDQQQQGNYYDLLLNQETSRYLFRILALKLILSDSENYGYKIYEGDLYPKLPTKSILITETIPDLSKFAKYYGTSLKTIKYLNPWILKDVLPIGVGKSYALLLPGEGYPKSALDEDAYPPVPAPNSDSEAE